MCPCCRTPGREDRERAQVTCLSGATPSSAQELIHETLGHCRMGAVNMPAGRHSADLQQYLRQGSTTVCRVNEQSWGLLDSSWVFQRCPGARNAHQSRICRHY